MQPTVLPKMPALLISISRGQDGQDDGLMRWTNSWCRQFTAHCSRLISAEYPTIANYIQGNARWTTTLLESLADKQEPTSLQHDTFQQNICRVHTTNEVSSSASRPECLQLVRQVVYRLQDGQKRWWKKKTKKMFHPCRRTLRTRLKMWNRLTDCGWVQEIIRVRDQAIS